MLKVKRYAYFLIWGHGLEFSEEILSILRRDVDIDILRIQDFRPKSISRFVRKVYSYDYAPFSHLKDKTRYLLKTPQKVKIIFIRNNNAKEKLFGEGDFCHVECERIKKIKEQIRDKFNPRIDGKKTEQHVIHASDNEKQVSHLLKVLGFRQGLEKLMRHDGFLVDIPYYLQGFNRLVIKEVPIKRLRARVIVGDNKKHNTKIVELNQTPQYAFLDGKREKYTEYLKQFSGTYLTSDYSEERLLNLSEEFDYLDSKHKANYILVSAIKTGKYIILDGLHRACVLARKGKDRIIVGELK